MRQFDTLTSCEVITTVGLGNPSITSCNYHLGFGWVREKGASLEVSCTAGEMGCSLTWSLFPHEGNHNLRKSFLALSCAALGQGWGGSDVGKVFNVSKPIYIFLLQGSAELLHWKLGLL